MEELQPKIQAVKPQEKKHEYKLIGSAVNKKGLKLFSFNPSTNEICEVEILDKKTLDVTKGVGNKQAVINPNHLHVWALNKRNAERKFNPIKPKQ